MRTEINGEVLQISDLRELSATTAKLFRENALAVFKSSQRSIDVDLSKMIFIDSCGLGALLALQHVCHARKGRLRLKNPTRQVQQLLELTRIPQVMDVVSDCH